MILCRGATNSGYYLWRNKLRTCNALSNHNVAGHCEGIQNNYDRKRKKSAIKTKSEETKTQKVEPTKITESRERKKQNSENVSTIGLHYMGSFYDLLQKLFQEIAFTLHRYSLCLIRIGTAALLFRSRYESCIR